MWPNSKLFKGFINPQVRFAGDTYEQNLVTLTELDGVDLLNMTALFKLEVILGFEAQEVVRDRAKRRAGTWRTRIRFYFFSNENKNKTYFTVDLESSLIVYSSR